MEEREKLQLSGLQHFAFCPRQWALIHIEGIWSENLRTTEGELLHEKAHDALLKESRAGTVISRGMPICSDVLGLAGECDIVEFVPDEKGISLFGREGLYSAVPVEYKRGSPKAGDEDAVQLAAQAMCLEEMLCCRVPYGYLFYGEIRRRIKVVIGKELREKTRELSERMRATFEIGRTPPAKRVKSCNACSLKNFCLPGIGKKADVTKYIRNALKEEE